MTAVNDKEAVKLFLLLGLLYRNESAVGDGVGGILDYRGVLSKAGDDFNGVAEIATELNALQVNVIVASD